MALSPKQSLRDAAGQAGGAHNKQKVLLALSGGVDSSVAAALLVRQGYEVIGAFMKNWSGDPIPPPAGGASEPGRDSAGKSPSGDKYPAGYKSRPEPRDGAGKGDDPCWIDDRRDAMRVAAHLGIPFVTLNFEREYRQEVVEYLFREYAVGRTPNPDVLCNTEVKFPLLWREAKKLGADVIATGHYARIVRSGGKHRLLASVDKEKDQSYFLHGLTQNDLAHTMFPVGGMKKLEVRALARKLGLSTAEKRSTRGICFIGKMDMRAFLGKRIPERSGEIITTDGRRVGTHPGTAFFTIGQRHGLGVGGGAPCYVAAKDQKTNTLIVAQNAKDPALYRKEFLIREARWISGTPKLPISCRIRTRYREPLTEGVVRRARGGFRVICKSARRAVTPGQSVVFYRGQECLGGGVIEA
ncbi:MAG: tRNA 2-thiouridine(34) synthase MnmA [Patescibacteria group bacterium]